MATILIKTSLKSLIPNKLASIYTVNIVRYMNINQRFQYSTEKPIFPNDDLDTKAMDLIHKKNANPYLLFVKKEYKETVQKNPTLKPQNIIQLLGNTWKAMNFDQKLVFLDDASKQREEKKIELANLFKNEEEAKAFNERKRKAISMRRKELKEYRIKREKTMLNKPKRPLSAFFLFNKTLDRGEASVVDFIKGASQKWKSMPIQEKEKFEAQANTLYQKYELDLKEWETKMLSEGKKQLVRKSFLDAMKTSLNAQDLAAAKMRRQKSKKNLKSKKPKKAVNEKKEKIQ